MASITVTVEGVEQTLTFLESASARVDRAQVRAMNRAIGAARTVMVQAIAQDTGLATRKVREALGFREATLANPTATLAATLKPIPLIDFNARGPEPSRGKGRGVRYRLKGGRGHHPHAFIATMRSGHRGVFARKGTARLPIRELHGPSLGQVFEKYKSTAIARAQEMFAQRLKLELEHEGVIDRKP